MMAIFDIETPERFFHLIEQRFIRYQANVVKPTEVLLFIIMGLNHLREWIAPQFEPISHNPLTWPPANTPEKAFSKKVYEDADHKVIRALCNGVKHVKARGLTPEKPKHETSTAHDSNLDKWPDSDSVLDWMRDRQLPIRSMDIQ